MNRTHNEGSSLIEVLVAITLLALVAASAAAGLVLSHRINARTEELLQAQLRLSSCLEILREEGIDLKQIDTQSGIPIYGKVICPGVTVRTDWIGSEGLYQVLVVDDTTGQTVSTKIGGAS